MHNGGIVSIYKHSSYSNPLQYFRVFCYEEGGGNVGGDVGGGGGGLH